MVKCGSMDCLQRILDRKQKERAWCSNHRPARSPSSALLICPAQKLSSLPQCVFCSESFSGFHEILALPISIKTSISESFFSTVLKLGSVDGCLHAKEMAGLEHLRTSQQLTLSCLRHLRWYMVAILFSFVDHVPAFFTVKIKSSLLKPSFFRTLRRCCFK